MTNVTGDADLLALCARLRGLQAEWQRLCDATSDVPGGDGSPADLIFEFYSNWVWPGACLPDAQRLMPGTDPVRLLLDLPATTPDGLQAKAAAVLALDDAGGYSGCDRSDHWQFVMTLVRDAAGTAAMPLGEAFTPIASEAAPAPAL